MHSTKYLERGWKLLFSKINRRINLDIFFLFLFLLLSQKNFMSLALHKFGAKYVFVDCMSFAALLLKVVLC